MAHGIIWYENPRTGQRREAPIGFSWTNLFFGFFAPLFRSDWKWAVIQFFAALFSAGLCWLVFPFVYNRLYAKDLIRNGFRVVGNQPPTATQAPPPPSSHPTKPTTGHGISCSTCGQVNSPANQSCDTCGSSLKAAPASARTLSKIVPIVVIAIGLLGGGALFVYKQRQEQSKAKSDDSFHVPGGVYMDMAADKAEPKLRSYIRSKGDIPVGELVKTASLQNENAIMLALQAQCSHGGTSGQQGKCSKVYVEVVSFGDKEGELLAGPQEFLSASAIVELRGWGTEAINWDEENKRNGTRLLVKVTFDGKNLKRIQEPVR